jgi:hypothetical protein
MYIYNSENWCVRSGYLCQGVHKRWWCVEIFNIIRNKRSSKHLVTKTDPMELNKRHRHSHWSTAIPAMLCYVPWIGSCYFTAKNEGSVFEIEISTLRINSGYFLKINCHALYFKLFSYVSNLCLCFVHTAVSCQLYSSTKLLISFQNICFEKEVFAPYLSAHMNVFMLKYINFLQVKR